MSSSSLFRRLHELFPAKTTTTSSLPKTPKPKPTTTTATTSSSPKTTTTPYLPKTPRTQTLSDVVEKFKKSSDSSVFRGRYGAYEATVRRLAKQRALSHIEDILEHQKKYNEITNERFTVRLMSLYGKHGMFDHAHKLFDEMPNLKCDRTVLSFNALLAACVNSKKFDKIAEFFSELPEKLSIEPDRISYNTVVKAFCHMGSLDAAFSVVEEMEKNEIQPDLVTFNTLLDAFYRNNRLADAEKLWALMEEKNVVPNSRSYNPKLRLLVADNRFSAAVEVFEEMSSKGVKPDIYSFNALLKGCSDNKNLEEAKRWYGEIAKNDCAPDRATITMLLYLACDNGDFEFALELLKEAIRQRFLVNKKNMQPVVDGLVKDSKIEEAKGLVELVNSNKFVPFNLELPTDTNK